MTRADAMYYAGITMGISAFISCITQLSLPTLSRKFGQHNLLIFAVFLPLAIGRFMYVPIGGKLTVAYPPENIKMDFHSDVEIVGCPVSQKWCLTDNGLTPTQFILSHMICSAAMVLGVSLIQIILSKSLGKRPQGVYMGYLTSVGSASRIIAPICVTTLYAHYGLYVTFGGLGTVFLLTTVWLWIIRFVIRNVII